MGRRSRARPRTGQRAADGAPAWSFYILARPLRGRGEIACLQCIRACLQACRRNALCPGFSRCFPLCQPGKTTFGELVPPGLSPVATLRLRALRESTLDELHGSFSRTQDIFSRPPLRARSRPSQRLKPIPFRNGSARLKACPDTTPVIPKRAPKCRNSRQALERLRGRGRPAPQHGHSRYTGFSPDWKGTIKFEI